MTSSVNMSQRRFSVSPRRKWARAVARGRKGLEKIAVAISQWDRLRLGAKIWLHFLAFVFMRNAACAFHLVLRNGKGSPPYQLINAGSCRLSGNMSPLLLILNAWLMNAGFLKQKNNLCCSNARYDYTLYAAWFYYISRISANALYQTNIK